MVTILHPEGFEEAPLARFRQSNIGWKHFCPEEVVHLSSDTANLVYLIPGDILSQPQWPRLRVELAQANRLFLAWVPEPTTASIMACVRDGAHDVLAATDTPARWEAAMADAATGQALWLQLYGGRPLQPEDVLIGSSESLATLRQQIDRLASTDVCVLILGESGVGKERVAQALHKSGPAGPFVALNCAAIPKDLLEAELFGVEKGAFTGALKSRAGLVEQARGGTLFLDEIGEMDLSLQPKLLRFLETRRARRVGGDTEIQVRVRVVSATNRNLETEIREGRFREDLYYRLAEMTLPVAPLRERIEDIPDLARAFLMRANERFGKNFERIEPALLTRFQRHRWNGNVRELKSTIDRLVLLFDGPVLRSSWWDPPVAATPPAPSASAPTPAAPVPPTLPLPRADSPPGGPSTGALPNRRQRLAMAKQLLDESGNDFAWVAAQLGINSSTLWRWRKAGKL